MSLLVWLILPGLGLYLATLAAVGACARRSERRHGGARSISHPVDAAIVLGGPIDPDGMLGFGTRQRVRGGVAAWRAGKVGRLIMSDGILTGDGRRGGELMRAFAVGLGMPDSEILVEDRARNTIENLRLSFALAGREGLAALAIVTEAYHLPRAAALARSFGRPGIALIAAPGWRQHSLLLRWVILNREALAWWFNVIKIIYFRLFGEVSYTAALKTDCKH